MRHFVVIGLLLSQVSWGLIWLLRSPQTVSLEHLIPKDILGLIVVRNPPSDLESLRNTQLLNWLQEGVHQLRERVPDRLAGEIYTLFRADLESTWIVIHQATPKPEGSWRIHFSALLVPRRNHGEAVALRTELAVRNVFGAAQTRVLQRDNIRIYRGSEPGQILYQIQLPDLTLISNNEKGWQQTLRATVGREPTLADDVSFQRVKNHLPLDGGLFLYFRANLLFPLFPEFGYLIRWNEDQVSDQYYQVPRE